MSIVYIIKQYKTDVHDNADDGVFRDRPFVIDDRPPAFAWG
tara:strand:- start:3352 stop:3474 length:123 start_codon:yes stop_codon:yes gene_type:complete